jgi:galactose oxidase
MKISVRGWCLTPKRQIGRGYHSQTVLGDGSVFTLGGSWVDVSGQGYLEQKGERWDPFTNSWTVLENVRCQGDLLTDDAAGEFSSDNHMWLFAAPNGKVFHAGPAKRTHWIDVSPGTDGEVTPSALRGTRDAMNGNALMYDVGKLLCLGGAPDYNFGVASAEAFTIDINNEQDVVVTQVGYMTRPRAMANAVVLPTGQVLVFGGIPLAKAFSDDNAQLDVEMWDPATGNFTVLAPSMTVPRNYHSVALLLQDGRVLSSGGGLCNWGGKCDKINHLDAEIFSPPYLFAADGSAAVRPEIVAAPASFVARDVIGVEMADAAQYSFALVRLAATTHSMGNEFRRIPLNVASHTDREFTLDTPGPYILPPGSYFIFAVSASGVPSVAEVVLVSNGFAAPSRAPTMPTTFAPSHVPTMPTTQAPTFSPSRAPTMSTFVPTTFVPTTDEGVSASEQPGVVAGSVIAVFVLLGGAGVLLWKRTRRLGVRDEEEMPVGATDDVVSKREENQVLLT